MNSHAPSWAELRLDANKLSHFQKECYYDAHHLLDAEIPKLDRKLDQLRKSFDSFNIASGLNHGTTRNTNNYQTLNEPSPSTIATKAHKDNSSKAGASLPKSATTNFQTIQEQMTEDPVPVLEPARKPIPRSRTHSELMCFSPPPRLPTKQRRQSPRRHQTKVITITEDSEYQRPNEKTRVSRPKQKPPKQEVLTEPDIDDLDLERYEHLKPPPLPLSEYLRRNKPDVVARANQRLNYIQDQVERRKHLASSRIISSLERFRQSSRSSSRNGHNGYQTIQRHPSTESYKRTYKAPEYRVKCKLSEHEMKRLTAKTYRRLPEVSMRRKEELMNYMKVQNYKNKLEYSRRLLENRRHGVINYPLRTSCEDTSIISSQDDSMNGTGPGSADPFSSDPFY